MTTEHVLSEPYHPSNPDGRELWVVSCSCGYSTSPTGVHRAVASAKAHQDTKTSTLDKGTN